ncbi:MAG: NAD-dependent epimerase/dehydratase family protein [Bacteroidia bacterium]
MNLEEDKIHILAHTKNVWVELKEKTIFITGGTGFFGKWLLESFIYANTILKLNSKLFVLSRDPDTFLNNHPHFKNESLIFIKGDVRDFEFPTQPINYIIHAATEANLTLNAEQPLQMFNTIVEGTKHILELAKAKKVKSILHTSSGAIYGKQPYNVTHVAEDFTGSPDIYDKNAAYGEGKRVAEMLCNFYHNSCGVNSKIARCFAFVGPYQPLDSHYAVGNFIKDIITGNKIKINGDGTPYRSYLYAADLTIWLWTILIFGKPCSPYNVGSDEELTIEELAKLLVSISGKKIEIEIAQQKNNTPPLRYVPSIKKAEIDLGLKVFTNLTESLKKTIQYNLNERDN